MIGILGGSSLAPENWYGSGERRRVVTAHGACTVSIVEGAALISRHGPGGTLPPHRINHRVHLAALERLGVDRIVSIGSTGSLQPAHKPGTLLLAHDYYAPGQLVTLYDHRLHVTIPGTDRTLRGEILGALRDSALPVTDGGVYVQTVGHRFETVSEVHALAQHGDVVGMTCASEATLASELGIPHAILAMVDNYAHGIGEEPLTGGAFERQVAANRDVVLRAQKSIMRICE